MIPRASLVTRKSGYIGCWFRHGGRGGGVGVKMKGQRIKRASDKYIVAPYVSENDLLC